MSGLLIIIHTEAEDFGLGTIAHQNCTRCQPRMRNLFNIQKSN